MIRNTIWEPSKLERWSAQWFLLLVCAQIFELLMENNDVIHQLFEFADQRNFILLQYKQLTVL